MPRRPRNATGGYVYHVLNRAVGRMTLFESDADYAAFLRTLAHVQSRLPTRLLSLCLMPNHWHLLLWPQKDGQLSEFMRLLTVTHTQRWHAAHATSGTGPLYQGRFKAFPVQDDASLLWVARYIERNPLRADLAPKARLWPWSTSAIRHTGYPDQETLPRWLLTPKNWPAEVPTDRGGWDAYVERVQSQAEEKAVQQAIARSSPLGTDRWVKQTAARLGLGSTLRPRGRPRKRAPAKQQ